MLVILDFVFGKIYYCQIKDVIIGNVQFNIYFGQEVDSEVIECSMLNMFDKYFNCVLDDFDFVRYLVLNLDVVDVGVDLVGYYFEYGWCEGCCWV